MTYSEKHSTAVCETNAALGKWVIRDRSQEANQLGDKKRWAAKEFMC